MIRDPSDGSLKQLEFAPSTKSRSSFDELKAKSGENWGVGIEAEEKKQRLVKPAPTADQIRDHYAHYDLAFCPKQSAEEAR